MRANFHQQLDTLKEMVLRMAGLAEQAFQRSIEAFVKQDLAICDLVMRSEPAINELEQAIDSYAINLLATEQPMASDLRLVLAALRINKNLERVGDQAVNIARWVRDVSPEHSELPVDIPRLAELAASMIHRAVQAFAHRGMGEAESVLQSDVEVDRLNCDAFETLSELIQEKPSVARQALGTLLIARNIERVGDHATNIAEDVVFWVNGNDVRHSLSGS